MNDKTKRKAAAPDEPQRPSRRELIRSVVRYVAAGGLLTGGFLMTRRGASSAAACPAPACRGCPEFASCRQPQADRIRRSKLKR